MWETKQLQMNQETALLVAIHEQNEYPVSYLRIHQQHRLIDAAKHSLCVPVEHAGLETHAGVGKGTAHKVLG